MIEIHFAGAGKRRGSLLVIVVMEGQIVVQGYDN